MTLAKIAPPPNSFFPAEKSWRVVWWIGKVACASPSRFADLISMSYCEDVVTVNVVCRMSLLLLFFLLVFCFLPLTQNPEWHSKKQTRAKFFIHPVWWLINCYTFCSKGHPMGSTLYIHAVSLSLTCLWYILCDDPWMFEPETILYWIVSHTLPIKSYFWSRVVLIA